MFRRLHHAILLGASICAAASWALAADPAPSAQAELKAELPLLPLPKAPTRSLETASAADLATVDEVLAHLVSDDAQKREQARSALARTDARLVPAAAERLRRLADSADKLAMKRVLLALWSSDHKGDDEDKDDDSDDSLTRALAHPETGDAAWRDLVSALGLSRMFRAGGNIDATRQLVNVYVRFGEFLRVDTQKQLKRLGVASAAALIEASRHPAPKIAQWATRELQKRNLDNPSKLLQRAEGQTLADILRAYGLTRDPELARPLISFASSSQLVVRQGARQAIAAMGEVIHWPLRDAYETTTGKRAPREWSWDRTARELFREIDQNRLHDVLLAYEQGVRAHQQGKLDEMRRDFDQVLTEAPGFEDSEAIALGYFDYAVAKASSAPDDAADALHRASRLTQNEQLAHRVQSLLLTLQAEHLLERGLADQILLRRAVELDPDNQRARQRLEEITQTGSQPPAPMRRYATAAAIALLGALATLWLLRRPQQPKGETDQAPVGPDSAPP